MDNLKIPNKERLLAVFRGEVPDRVPNFEVLVANPAFSHIMEREIPDDNTLANIDPELYLEFVNRIGQDVIGMCFYDSPFRYLDEAGQERILDYRITDTAGLTRLFTANFDHLEPLFGMLEEYTRTVKATEVGVFALTGSFFCDTYTNVFGFENFMYLMYDNPSLIEEVLELHTLYHCELVKRLVQHNLTFLYIGDDIAYKGGTLIDPKLMREMWVPRMQRVFQPALDKGTPILFHSDGNIMELIPDLLDMGVNAINPVEPYGMDIREVKKRFGNRLALVGNMDVGGALSSGTPDQVRSEAKALIIDIGKDGGFVLASCHSITRNVQPENFLAMVETAHTFGVY